MSTPIISIIMPTFNRLQYLRPAVNSVFAQSFADWELIIADDGSDAETLGYLRSLADKRVMLICLAHTGKPSVTSNIALRAARGEFVAFLDSDDLWLPNKLEMQLQSLRRHPQRQWSYTRFALVDCTGCPVVAGHAKQWPTPSGWILTKLLEEVTVIAQPSVMVSRQLLEHVGAFDEDLVMCYDDELWFRLAAQSEIDGIGAPLTLVRRHGQHSGSDVIAWRDRRRVFEKALQKTRGTDLEPLLRRLRARMSAGLAKSYATSGERLKALTAFLKSLPHTWSYPECWLGALGTIGLTFAPAPLRERVRNHRKKRHLASPVP